MKGRYLNLNIIYIRMKGTVSGQPCTIRAPLQSLLPTEFVARQVKFPASLMSTLLISKEAVPSTKAILYLSEEATSLPSLNQDTLMGREPGAVFPAEWTIVNWLASKDGSDSFQGLSEGSRPQETPWTPHLLQGSMVLGAVTWPSVCPF